MSVKQTKCPFCGCAFYITSLQLNAYRGQARCGECHQVFDAMSNLVDDPTPSLSDMDNDSTTIETSPVEETHVSAVDEPVLSVTHKVAETELPVTEATPQPDPHEEQDLRFSDDQGLGHDVEEAKLEKISESSISMELGTNFDSKFLEEQQFGSQDPLKSHDEEVEKLNKGADDSWIEHLLAEDKNTSESTIASDINQPQTDSAPQLNEIPVVLSTAYNMPTEINENDEDLLSYLNRTGVTTLANQSDDSLIFSADQKPAEHRILRPTHKPVDTSYIFGWGIMCLMMFGLLITQYIYFNFDKMAFNPTTSLYMHKVCELAHCSLPYMNKDELHISKVRLSSKDSQQTTFTARLVNSARLSQPFPALRLSLKRDGKVVASQIIQPRQYLPENLKTFSRITTKTPYPVQFTIKYKKSDIQDYTLEPEYN